MLHVAVLFLNGGCASTALLPMEVFRNAGVLWNLLNGNSPTPRFRVTTATADGRAAITDHLASIIPSCSLDEVKQPDIVFVPAGGLPFDALVRTGYVIESVIECNAAVIPWLQRWAAEGAKIAGVCSGVALLAKAGLLDGRRATTHWGLTDVYRSHFPNVDWQPEYLITEDGNVFCSGGINSAADLSLYLVERYGDRELALECAKSLLLEMPRTCQIGFADATLRATHDDAKIQRAQDWLHQHFQEAVSVEEIASRVGMSPRNFVRRFKDATEHTPCNYIQCIRIEVAKRLLEDRERTIQEVSQAVGYEDLSFFRNLFKRQTGVCPAEYRSRFGPSRTADRLEPSLAGKHMNLEKSS